MLASLWPVSDKISMIFMVEFYKNLSLENNIFTAYRKAVKQVCEITDNPALWGAFVLLGI
ncbi:MAG: CHAT domain-containing protein [FCB group bacterium]|nr:CHAT domain-containing protein [FCB group bacterium]